MFGLFRHWFVSNARKHWHLSKELGEDHPKTQKALKALNAEYTPCLNQEMEFFASITSRDKFVVRNVEQALQLADKFCRAMNAPSIKRILPNDHQDWAIAYYHYGNQSLHLDFPVLIDHFLHELTHHIQSHIDFWDPFRKGHGKKFCEIERKLFALVLKEEPWKS